MQNFLYHKHFQCLINETNYYTNKYERPYPLLPTIIIICINLLIGIILLLSRLLKNRSKHNGKQNLDSKQTALKQHKPFISLSSPPSLWTKSAHHAQYLTTKNLKVAAIEDCISNSASEPIGDYRIGGYMPCDLGQTIGRNQEYGIIRKLGWGHFGTVWLCENTKINKYRAVKISKASKLFHDAAHEETKILEAIRDMGPGNDESDKIILLRDIFLQESVNGLHVCLAFDVMGPSLWELLVQTGFMGFDQTIVKTIIRQVLLALTYLHGVCNIIHTDIKPENILVVVKESYIKEMVYLVESYYDHDLQLPKSYMTTLDWNDYIETENSCGSKSFIRVISHQARTRDDSSLYANKTTTQHSLKPSSFPLFLIDKNIQIKLADLGNACKVENCNAPVIQTIQYRALEVLLQSGYSYPADLWSVACVAFELSTGEYLFNPQQSSQLSLVEDHLGLIWETLNGIPDYIAKGGKVSDQYFDSNGYLRCILPQHLKIWRTENVLVEKYNWKKLHAILLAHFIEYLIEPDPQLRGTAFSALEHKWFKE